MKTILIITLSFWISGNGNNEVYICKGPNSKVYHKSDRCKGLSSCSTVISKVSKDEAVKLGRRECKIEFR